MSEYSLKERAQMLTSLLVYGGPMTFEQIKKLDWLKNTSEYGIFSISGKLKDMNG